MTMGSSVLLIQHLLLTAILTCLPKSEIFGGLISFTVSANCTRLTVKNPDLCLFLSFRFRIFSKPSPALAPSWNTSSLGAAGTTFMDTSWHHVNPDFTAPVLPWVLPNAHKPSLSRVLSYPGPDHNLTTGIGFGHALLSPITCRP